MELVVGLGVHEHVLVGLAVEELHLALVDDRLLDLLGGTEGSVDHGPGAGVLEGRADERAALARLHVLEVDDGEQPVVELAG